MHYLTDPWHVGFSRHALIAGILAGALCGLVGVYVVLRRMSYIGHGLSHAIFGGAVASYVANINFYLGAGIWGFVSALLINGVSRRRQIGADAAIGVVTTASFAIGVALISHVHHLTVNPDAALFGNILGVSISGLYILLGVFVFVGAVVFFRYRQLLFITFDPEVADAYGVNSKRYDTLFAAGCGRLFEGTPAEMWRSLSALAALPGDTRVYCGHEYTLANLRFAAAVEPGNPAIASRTAREQAKRDRGVPTLPASRSRLTSRRIPSPAPTGRSTSTRQPSSTSRSASSSASSKPTEWPTRRSWSSSATTARPTSAASSFVTRRV